jgi:predicted nucleic acid-binding protein
VTYYFDTSAVMRVVIGQSDALADWDEMQPSVSNALLEPECGRVLDRLRLRKKVDPAQLLGYRTAVRQIVDRTELVEIDRVLLDRAGQAMPAPLATLDAIHLVTALLWREHIDPDVTLATHDVELAAAARLFGLPVIGA